MQLASLIISLIVAIPKLQALWDQLIALYVAQQIDNMHENDRKAIRKAIHEKDQRDLEKQLGNSQAGEPSHLPGTSIVTDLPGLPGPKKK